MDYIAQGKKGDIPSSPEESSCPIAASTLLLNIVIKWILKPQLRFGQFLSFLTKSTFCFVLFSLVFEIGIPAPFLKRLSVKGSKTHPPFIPGGHTGPPDIQPSSVEIKHFTSFEDFALPRVQVKVAFRAWHFIICLII